TVVLIGQLEAHARTGMALLQLPGLERIIGEEEVLDRVPLLPHPTCDVLIRARGDPVDVSIADLAPPVCRHDTVAEAVRDHLGALGRGGCGSHRTIVPDPATACISAVRFSVRSVSCPSSPVRSAGPRARGASGSVRGSLPGPARRHWP